MNTKRISCLVLLLTLVAVLLSGCGQKYTESYGGYDGAYADEPAWYVGDSYSVSGGYASVSDEWDDDWSDWSGDSDYDGGSENSRQDSDGGSVDDVDGSPSLAEKIIYSADASVETVDFDQTVADVEAMVSSYGGFFEDSYVSGSSYSDAYYNNQVLRTASYTIRIPCDRFAEATAGLSRLGQVTSLHRYTENVTSRFTDLESHLTALRTEEASLVAMMEQADTVADLIEIQSRLSDVRYEIEYYTSTMRNLQNEVDYSTITLRVQEVKVLTTIVEPQMTYWEQMGAGFMSSLGDVGRFFQNAFMAVVTNLPMILFALILLGLLVFLVVHFVRKAARRNASYSVSASAQQMPPPPPAQPIQAVVPPAVNGEEHPQ